MQNLIQYLNKNIKHFNFNTIKKYYLSDEVLNIMKKYNFTIEELCYRLRKNISLDYKFICKFCGKPIIFNKHTKYATFCSLSCSSQFHAKDINIINKTKSTLIKRYGVDNPMKSPICRNKSKETCKQKYGKPYFLQTQIYKNKSKLTCLYKYGVDNYSQSKEFKDRKVEIQEKIKNRNRQKYNVDYYVQSIDHKNKKDFILNKCYITKSKNKTWNTSKSEKEVGRLLGLKFKDVRSQYKSNLYPFTCDYYIGDIDTYIECNYHWSHMPEFGEFDSNNKIHISKLNELKSKNTLFTKKIIEVWTVKDPLKLNTFKKNKLKYKIFYTIDDFYKWYSTINP